MSEAVFEVDANVQYEWATFKVYEHPSRPDMYVTKWESGCSCNWFEEPDIIELRASEPVYKTELRNRLKSFLTERPYYFNAGEAIRHIERLQEFLNAEADR